MKRLLFIILLFGVCLTFNRAHAQRCLPGMRGIQLTGGLSDNMRWKNGDGFGYHAGIAVSTYTKNAHHWVVGAEYLEKRYGYRDLPLSGEPVHERGRLLPELPFRPEEDVLRRTGAVRPCRVRDGELGREPAAGRLPAHG